MGSLSAVWNQQVVPPFQTVTLPILEGSTLQGLAPAGTVVGWLKAKITTTAIGRYRIR